MIKDKCAICRLTGQIVYCKIHYFYRNCGFKESCHEPHMHYICDTCVEFNKNKKKSKESEANYNEKNKSNNKN
jgi:hypothetical protein